MISVVILTLNEEVNLANCLEGVKWSDDVIVIDSGSNDLTVEIARAAGARVVRHSAGSELEQRTYALKAIDFKYGWVYNPDADEETPRELSDEMLAAVGDNSNRFIAYRVRFRTMFMGKWLRYSSLYPTWVMRLFRPEKICFQRSTNLTYTADGPVGLLKNHFVHHTFRKGFDEWFAKHNKYSGLEARETVRSLLDKRINWANVINRDSVLRRYAVKELSYRLPLRPTLRFVYMYFLRRGFLDGRAGLTYCRLLSMYEYMIVLKMRELRRREQGLAI